MQKNGKKNVQSRRCSNVSFAWTNVTLLFLKLFFFATTATGRAGPNWKRAGPGRAWVEQAGPGRKKRARAGLYRAQSLGFLIFKSWDFRYNVSSGMLNTTGTISYREYIVVGFSKKANPKSEMTQWVTNKYRISQRFFSLISLHSLLNCMRKFIADWFCSISRIN